MQVQVNGLNVRLVVVNRPQRRFCCWFLKCDDLHVTNFWDMRRRERRVDDTLSLAVIREISWLEMCLVTGCIESPRP